MKWLSNPREFAFLLVVWLAIIIGQPIPSGSSGKNVGYFQPPDFGQNMGHRYFSYMTGEISWPTFQENAELCPTS